jgi:hypothetical protein
MQTGLVAAACLVGLTFAVLGFSLSVEARAEIVPETDTHIGKSDLIVPAAEANRADFMTVLIENDESRTSTLARVMAN